MKWNGLIRKTIVGFGCIAGLHLALFNQAQAITTNVAVMDDFFSPSAVTINTGDTVKWTWAGGGLVPHNTIGPGTPALWGSPLTAVVGTTFSHSFAAAGTYSYVCSIHALIGMTGSVTVQGSTANVPPTVAMTSPANGAVFSAPWSGTVQATASDSDGDTITKVQFFAGANPLGTVSNPGPTASFNVPSLAAGNYTLKAVATDSRGATNSSAGVTIHVVTPAPITLSAIQRLSASSTQFTFSTTPGLNYVVQRSSDLANFAPIGTVSANAGTMTFTDNNASGIQNFYRIGLQPNP
jgi:plastocyanin